MYVHLSKTRTCILNYTGKTSIFDIADSADPDEIDTHYHNSNLIWRTVSRRVDEVIPSDHPRHVASRVVQWYGLVHET